MIFSLPSLVPFIAAALLPWILHLFLFRKAETLRFPSLFFLKQCYGWSSRLKLHKLLLLLTRSALILYFILAMLDPRIERASTAGLPAVHSPTLLVLDDRPAMKMKLLARPDSLFDVYKQAAIADLERRSLSQEIAAVSLSELAVLSSIRFVSPRQAAAALRNASVQTLTPAAEQNIRLALDRFAARVLFYSPFQIHLRDPRFERLGPTIPCEPNLTILGLKAPSDVAAGQPVSVQVDVADLYGRPADAMVRIGMDGREMAVVSAEQGRASFLLTALPLGPHLLAADVINAGTDGYPEDDRRTTEVRVAADQPVGFASTLLPNPLLAALDAFDRLSAPILLVSPQEWESKLRVIALDLKNVHPDAVRAGLNRGLELVIFSDALASDPAAVKMISGFDVNIAPADALTGIRARDLQEIWSNPADAALSRTFSAENRSMALIRKMKIVPRPEDEVLASFSDGFPAVVRRRAGPGSMVLAAFSIADPYLQADPAFLLFVQSLLSVEKRMVPGLLSAAGEEPRIFSSVPLQTNAAIPLGPAAPPAAIRLVSSASSVSLSLGYAQGRFFAEIPAPAPPPGLYRMLIGSQEKGTVHLYPAPPAPLALPESQANLRRSISMEAFFFWMAVLLMAVELLLLRHMQTTREAPHAS